jgi:glutamine synthetase
MLGTISSFYTLIKRSVNRVMGNFVHTKTLEPWSACPRAFLKRMINELAKEGLTAKCGFENEVFFFKQENDKYSIALLSITHL